MFGTDEVSFSSIGPKTERRLDRQLRECQALRRMLVAQKLELIVAIGEQALCDKEGGIASKSLI
jgi:hypothetical protein